MKINKKSFTLIFLIFLIAIASNVTMAMLASELQNFKVLGYHFTTKASSDKTVWTPNDALNNRIIVFKCSAKNPSGDGIIFTTDFLLRYFDDNGKENRSSALRICTAKTTMPGEEDNCIASRNGWINIGKGDVIFTVSFILENDVDKVEILRVGDTETTHYNISDERPYSVFITTNRGIDNIKDIIDVIKSGGYRILRTSGNLNPDNKGITVYYSKSVEVQAREISQRIMTKTNIAPSVEESNFSNSDSDIVIWIGK